MAAVKPALRGLVTGASSGIGRSTVALLAEQYTLSVTLVGRDEGALAAVASSVAAAGGSATPVVCDVASTQQVAAAWAQHVAVDAQCDFLVLNAGLNRGGKVHEAAEADWDAVMDVVRGAAPGHPRRCLHRAPPPRRTSRVCGRGCLTRCLP